VRELAIEAAQFGPYRLWKFTNGLVGGSFANAANVSASFRPIVWVGGCPSGVADITLAQTDINELINF
jgi:hypothetical protein